VNSPSNNLQTALPVISRRTSGIPLDLDIKSLNAKLNIRASSFALVVLPYSFDSDLTLCQDSGSPKLPSETLVDSVGETTSRRSRQAAVENEHIPLMFEIFSSNYTNFNMKMREVFMKVRYLISEIDGGKFHCDPLSQLVEK
jgi:hypothetical protein